MADTCGLLIKFYSGGSFIGNNASKFCHISCELCEKNTTMTKGESGKRDYCHLWGKYSANTRRANQAEDQIPNMTRDGGVPCDLMLVSPGYP